MIHTMNPPNSAATSKQQQNGNEAATNDNETILGFKTLRLFNNKETTVAELKATIEFIKSMIPCSRFVVNYQSDVLKQAESQGKYFGSKNEVDELMHQNDMIRQAYTFLNTNSIDDDDDEESDAITMNTTTIDNSDGTNSAYLLDSSEWTKNVDVLNDVVHWLGYNEHCKFDYLLEYNTNNGYAPGNLTNYVHDAKCQLL